VHDADVVLRRPRNADLRLENKPSRSKIVNVEKIHPCATYGITVLVRSLDTFMIGRGYSPRMRNTTSVNHTAIANKIIIFSLFQMATLPRFLKCPLLGDNDDDDNASETYIRSRINSEAAANEVLGRT
jgi:hypothetical protein